MVKKKITAEGVAEKTFTPVRLREGYSIDEVDSFLDQIEYTLGEQEREIVDLREQIKKGFESAHSSVDGSPKSLAELDADRARIAELEQELAAALANTGAPSLADASSTTAQMLEMAARQHDDLINQGQQTKQKMIDDARAEAEQLLSSARQKLAAEQEALEKSKREHLVDLQVEKSSLEASISSLRQIESTSRAELERHWTQQLEDLKKVIVPSERVVDGAVIPPEITVSDTIAPAPAQEVNSHLIEARTETQAERSVGFAPPVSPKEKEPAKETPPTPTQPRIIKQDFPSFYEEE